MSFDFKEIESKWQRIWDERKVFEAEVDKNRKKVFITFCFPYTDGHLHVGHAFTSLKNDVYARFKRLQGYNVLFPWAWHWTGEPIAGMAKRIANNDKILISLLQRIDKVPEEEIKKFTDPLYIASYFTKVSREAIKRLGYSIDWRREFNTTSYNKGFSEYIKWQYLKLRELGYVAKGTHPVVWCPRDESPTGDHDRLQGEGVSPEEFYLLKFKFKDSFLLAATLRPETIFGVTNLWVKPGSRLAKIKVFNENWIVSKETLAKLKGQDYEYELIEEIEADKLIGEFAEAPLVNKRIPILPANFIDTNVGTGIVYSVPAHAPYDLVALMDLSKEGKFNEILKEIKLIHIIDTPKLGTEPALSFVEKMGIKDQNDPKLEEVTKQLYFEEFSKGIMGKGTMEFEGMKVKEAREKVFEKLKDLNLAIKLYDLLTPVVCRCGTRCIVVLLKDQWFLRYSDPEWKEKAKQALAKMKIIPEEARNWFKNTIDWLEDKACARKSGLGTPLPWDEKWIVETLSDSTIYMPYYIISKYVNLGLISPENLKPEFFDHVILGIGDLDNISKITGISKELLKKIREDFEYWYPVDLRTSAKELIPNHLTFYIFHHVALLPEDKWPRMIAVNGMINIEGKKLSKSKGNIITIKEAIEKYSADIVRFYLATLAEGMEDAEWTWKGIEESANEIRNFFIFVSKIIESEDGEEGELDGWLLSVFQKRIKDVTEFLEDLRLRSAIVNAYYGVFNDIKWYLKRSKKVNYKMLKELIKEWLILLSPFIPHICEELWMQMGNKELIVKASWPRYKEEFVNIKEEAKEALLIKVYEDIKNVSRNKTFSKIYIYVPSKKKYEIISKINEMVTKIKERKRIIEELKIAGYDAKLISQIFEYYFSLQEELRKAINYALEIDLKIAEGLKKLFEDEGIKCLIYNEEEATYDPLGKSEKALPFKLGLYLE